WQGGVMWGFMGGLGLDLLSGGPLGAAALGMVMMTYFASLTEGRFWRSHVLLPLATVLLGTVGFHAIYLLGLSFAGHPISLGEALWRVTLPSALLNAVFMLPVYNVLRWLRAFISPAPVAF
ncbi:MAG: rod shape-determining protein MreD, partial [Anaerolineales bacterium]